MGITSCSWCARATLLARPPSDLRGAVARPLVRIVVLASASCSGHGPTDDDADDGGADDVERGQEATGDAVRHDEHGARNAPEHGHEDHDPSQYAYQHHARDLPVATQHRRQTAPTYWTPGTAGLLPRRVTCRGTARPRRSELRKRADDDPAPGRIAEAIAPPVAAGPVLLSRTRGERQHRLGRCHARLQRHG